MAEHLGLASRGGDQAEQDLQKRGLAGAVGAHQAGDARADLDGERVEGQDRTVVLGQPVGAYHCLHAPQSSRPARPVRAVDVKVRERSGSVGGPPGVHNPCSKEASAQGSAALSEALPSVVGMSHATVPMPHPVLRCTAAIERALDAVADASTALMTRRGEACRAAGRDPAAGAAGGVPAAAARRLHRRGRGLGSPVRRRVAGPGRPPGHRGGAAPRAARRVAGSLPARGGCVGRRRPGRGPGAR